MAQTKQQKVEIVEKISGALKGATAVVFVNFRGMNVADDTMMRKALREAGLGYEVVKKTLLRRALSALGHDGENAPIEGEVAIAYGGADDATVAARMMHEFGKKFTGKLGILGGVFEGKLASATLMQEIATIPPMLTLRGMFAQVVNSPRQRFAVVLSKVAETKN